MRGPIATVLAAMCCRFRGFAAGEGGISRCARRDPRPSASGKPGCYVCVIHLLPHSDPDGLSAAIRITTELTPLTPFPSRKE